MGRQDGRLGRRANSAAEALRQKVVEYCKRHRHSDLSVFTVPDHDIKSWEGTEVSYRPGCYTIYSEGGDLLDYIGKASLSASVGSRLVRFRYKPPTWLSVSAFVQIVQVSEAFEAPSLEEWLIRELQPRFDDRGIKRLPLMPANQETTACRAVSLSFKLDDPPTSFETPAVRAPQDEALSQCHQRITSS
jgi:hypothetical protein